MKSLKQEREDAEQEYYEKDSRVYRWGVISYNVGKVSAILKDYSRDYCDCQRCGHSSYIADYMREYGENPPDGKCARCREERRQLEELIEEFKRLHETTQEIYRRYDEARVSRPLHLP